MSKEVAEEYLSSLADLTVNSKPLINMLTMLADENVDHAPAIVQVIESHIEKVSPEVKLPILYLIDSIIKNVSQVYVPLFTQNIVSIFASVFEKVDEKTRLNMYKLRQTWSDVFPPRKMYALDLRVKGIDNAWPITAPPPTSIHLNPKFLGNKGPSSPEVSSSSATPPQIPATPAVRPAAVAPLPETTETQLRDQLLKKQKILIELQQKKLELELMHTKAILEEQQKQQQGPTSLLPPLVRPLNEEAVKMLSQKSLVKPKAVVMPPSVDSAPKPVPPSNVMANLMKGNANVKTKIAPVNTQLLEAVKSRDPRLARQQLAQTVLPQPQPPPEVTFKEQEIFNRQLAMLKTPVVEQVVPVQRVLSETSSNSKSHITINVDRSRVRESKYVPSSKKSIRDQSSSSRNKKPPSPKESKSSGNKNSKSASPRSAKSSSQKRVESPVVKVPAKNERSAFSAAPKQSSPKRDGKYSSKKSPKKSKNSSPKSSRNKAETSPTKSSVSSTAGAEDAEKSPRKSKKSRKDVENESKHVEIPTQKSAKPAERKEKSPTPSPPSKAPSPNRAEKKESSDSKSPKKEDVENIPETEKSKKSEKPETSEKPEVKKEPVENISLFELIESSPSPEPPPPPIISRINADLLSDKKDDLDYEDFSEEEKEMPEMTGFKDIKGAAKGRNYIRRNREDSLSPQKEATGDVDLRTSGPPPEKQARLLFEEEKSSDIEKNLVNVSGKDVDLRLLTVGSSSPSKKRLSTDAANEEPPKKKNKSEVFDELFGNEDVDLRQMPAVNINSGERLPSPPPPPVISNGPVPPQVAAIAPLVIESNKSSPVPENDSSQQQPIEELDKDENSRESFDSGRGRYRRRERKPEAEVKPMSLSSQLELEMASRKESSYSHFGAPEKENKKLFRERISPRGELDRLGRPLLYNKLPNDPRARRESLGGLDGRDTDMRRLGGLMEREVDTNINVNMIVAQAEDQLRSGTMTLNEYNELLKQVIQVNEVQKMREAQNKGRQENRRMLHHRGRRSPNRFGPQNRNSPPFRHDEERRDRRPFNDIDERLQMPWRHSQRNDAEFNRMRYPPGSNRGGPYDVPNSDSRNFEDRAVKSEIWEDDRQRFRRPHLEDMENAENRLRDGVIPTERTNDCVDVPIADFGLLETIAKDPMKSINIDGTPRDIRFYGDTAVVMLSWDDPKEISFENGIRRVVVGDISLTCALNDPYVIFMLNGNPHRIRLGAPTRELYIDGEFYEAHFGGPPITVELDGLKCPVQLEGPPPQVKIGEKRTDLICGRVNVFVDATAMLPLYLDAKPQRFDLRSCPYVFKFTNALKTLLINDVPVDVQFGGGYRQICGYGNLHFIRISMLPSGVVPGNVKIVNMENTGSASSINPLEGLTGVDSPPNVKAQTNPDVVSVPDHKPIEVPQPRQTTGKTPAGGPLDILTSLMTGATTTEPVGFNYQVENKQPNAFTPVADVSAIPLQTQAHASVQPAGLPVLGSTVNINDLFQRLVATGIVSTGSATTGNQQPQAEAPLKAVTFDDSNSLKEKQAGIVNMLYSGIQCSSCGVRFAPEETVKYSRHLDWHFRQNRREKDAARKGQSRKWYYDVSDWIQFEEIEDLEERAQSWFETEAASHVEEPAEQEEMKSVPAPPGDETTSCEVCRDQFDTFYNEEKEEWHLKPCILVEEKYYHPICYEDLMNMPEDLPDKSIDNLNGSKDESEVDRLDVKVEAEDVGKTEDSAGNFQDVEDDESRDVAVNSAIRDMIQFVVDREEREKRKAEEETENVEEIIDDEEDEVKEEEIEVLENVTVEQKKNIIDVDLIEKMDDEDDIVYQPPKPPSPVVFSPNVKIKQEPVDEMESPVAVVDQTYTNVVASIDGNVEMIETPQITAAPPSKIKITFNKPITSESKPENPTRTKDKSEAVADEDPEPLPLKPKKPRIAEREMTVYLPCVKGTEVSGLCTIM